MDRQKSNSKDTDPTGLVDEGHRYRDLETGSFITRDPMGFVDGPNLYTYVNQNPWTHDDPEGLFIWGFFVDAGFAAYDTYSAVTAKNATERNWAYASLGVDAAGFGTDIFDGGAGGGVALATAGRIAIHAKEAAQIAKDTKQGLQMASAATHAGEAGTQAADSGGSGANGDGTGKGSSSQGGSPGGKTAEQTTPPNPYGSPGKPDHQDATAELKAEMEAKYPASEGYTVEVNTSIKGDTGVNRRPDVTVRDKDGKVVQVGEAARTKADGTTLVPREQTKQNEYQQAGIPSTVKKIPPANSQTPPPQQSQTAPASSGGS